MSRSDYGDDYCDDWNSIMYRGWVTKALRGRRGQAFLKELVAALDAMPVKELVAEKLVDGENVCAIGAVCKARGLDVSDVNPENYNEVARRVGLAPSMVREIVYCNDEAFVNAGPAARWLAMHKWAKENIREI